MSFSLPGYLIQALDDELAATGQTSRSKLLVDIITFWMENKPTREPASQDYIQEDLDRFRQFIR